MQDTPTETAKSPFAGPLSAPLDLRALGTANQPGLAAMADMHQHMLKRAADVNGEMLSFLKRRLESDSQCMKELTTCKSLPEVYSTYAAFMQKMMRDYAEEMSAVATLYAGQAEETVEEMQEQVGQMAEAANGGDSEGGKQQG